MPVWIFKVSRDTPGGPRCRLHDRSACLFRLGKYARDFFDRLSEIYKGHPGERRRICRVSQSVSCEVIDRKKTQCVAPKIEFCESAISSFGLSPTQSLVEASRRFDAVHTQQNQMQPLAGRYCFERRAPKRRSDRNRIEILCDESQMSCFTLRPRSITGVGWSAGSATWIQSSSHVYVIQYRGEIAIRNPSMEQLPGTLGGTRKRHSSTNRRDYIFVVKPFA